MSFETVSVIGLGYIGLPTAAMLARCGKKVIGVDINSDVVDTINAGKIHIVEPELEDIVNKVVGAGLLVASETVLPADAFLIAVPTPFKLKASADVPQPDLGFIRDAVISIAKVLKKGDLVIVESTSPVGTTEQVVEWLSSERDDLNFPNATSRDADVNVAYCPERVLPGHVVRELVENDRVIGGISEACSTRAVELYTAFVSGECVITSARTAEMTKLTENSCRDVQIAFANELSVICEKLNVDVWELIELANRHPRINILQPGPGVGGHCIAVDPWFIVSKTPEEARLIHTARRVNDDKPKWVVDQVLKSIASVLETSSEKSESELRVGCFGLTFKADIDDLRESPSLGIVQELSKKTDVELLLVEPNITHLPRGLGLESELWPLESALEVCDIALLLVDHKEFKAIDRIPSRIELVDTKGIWRDRLIRA